MPGGVVHRVRIDVDGRRKGFSAVGGAREPDVSFPLLPLVAPADVDVALRRDRHFRRILVPHRRVPVPVVDADGPGKVDAVRRVAQHHVTDFGGSLDVDEIKASATVRGYKRIVLTVSRGPRGHGTVLVRLPERLRPGGDQTGSDQEANEQAAGGSLS